MSYLYIHLFIGERFFEIVVLWYGVLCLEKRLNWEDVYVK
jgi:hypothetical protein